MGQGGQGQAKPHSRMFSSSRLWGGDQFWTMMDSKFPQKIQKNQRAVGASPEIKFAKNCEFLIGF